MDKIRWLVLIIVLIVIVGFFISVRYLSPSISVEDPDSQRLYQAIHSIEETFNQTRRDFLIYPKRDWMSSNDRLIVVAGIKNNAEDDQLHNFVINVIPGAVSNDVVEKPCNDPSGLSCTVIGQSQTAEQLMETWYSFDTTPIRIQNGGQGLRHITISSTRNTPEGVYTFTMVACTEPITTAEQCTLETTNWGEPQQLVITIQS